MLLGTSKTTVNNVGRVLSCLVFLGWSGGMFPRNFWKLESSKIAISSILSQVLYSFMLIRDVLVKKTENPMGMGGRGGGGGGGRALDPLLVVHWISFRCLQSWIALVVCSVSHFLGLKGVSHSDAVRKWAMLIIIIIIIIIIYNLYRGKAPVTGSDFQGGPLRMLF